MPTEVAAHRARPRHNTGGKTDRDTDARLAAVAARLGLPPRPVSGDDDSDSDSDGLDTNDDNTKSMGGTAPSQQQQQSQPPTSSTSKPKSSRRPRVRRVSSSFFAKEAERFEDALKYSVLSAEEEAAFAIAIAEDKRELAAQRQKQQQQQQLATMSPTLQQGRGNPDRDKRVAGWRPQFEMFEREKWKRQEEEQQAKLKSMSDRVGRILEQKRVELRRQKAWDDAARWLKTQRQLKGLEEKEEEENALPYSRVTRKKKPMKTLTLPSLPPGFLEPESVVPLQQDPQQTGLNPSFSPPRAAGMATGAAIGESGIHPKSATLQEAAKILAVSRTCGFVGVQCLCRSSLQPGAHVSFAFTCCSCSG